LRGQPWARRQESTGWAVVARRVPDHEAALLLTDDPSARVGWYAATALDATMTGVVLEGDGSVVALVRGGHMILVDRARSVAGGVAAAGFEMFRGLTHTGAGLAAFRDVDAATREVVVGTTVQGRFTSVRAQHPAGPQTEAVFVANFGQLLAVTDRGVEVLPPGSDRFTSVATWPTRSVDGGTPRTSSQNPTLGWLADGTPVIATVSSAASPRCADFAPPTQAHDQ
jgi:hypothetical protein